MHYQCIQLHITVTRYNSYTYYNFIGRYISHIELHDKSQAKGKAIGNDLPTGTMRMYDNQTI